MLKRCTFFLGLLFLFGSTDILPQLKELEVTPTQNRGQIPIFRDYPDKAAIFFYTEFDNLSFYSSYGIIETTGDQAGGKYIIIIEPTRQAIEVRCKGYKTEIIKIGDLQPRDVLYYQVEQKKGQGFSGNEIAVTIQINPNDAKVSIDGTPVSTSSQVKLELGNHSIMVEKEGYAPLTEEILVTADNTLFSFNLVRVTAKAVSIRSVPTGAALYINNAQNGETDKGLFLSPGVYKIRLEKEEFFVLDTAVVVTAEKDNQEFKFDLVKNRGSISINVIPSTATISLNGERINNSTNYNKPPGIYNLQISEFKYQNHTETFELKLGENKNINVNLKKNTGQLVLKIAQKNAKLKINRELTEIKDTLDLIPGTYHIEVSVNNFEPFVETIDIKLGSLITKIINLDQSTGILKLNISPKDAKIFINKEDRTGFSEIELSPAIYEIEISAPTYKTQLVSVKIEKQKNETLNINLVQKIGSFQFQVSPFDAEVELRQADVVVQKWRGIKMIQEIAEGSYEIEIKNLGYLTLKKQIVIRENQTTFEDITLKKGFESYRVETGNAGYELLFIEGGDFNMGCNSLADPNCEDDEKPVRNITIDGFYIGSSEVPKELYFVVMGKQPESGKEKLPATGMNWFEAIDFCNKLSQKEGLKPAYTVNGSDVLCDFSSDGYRLPTEAEWEYAARGGNKSNNYIYSGSNLAKDVAVYSDISNEIKPKGARKPNQLGLYDMSGNVWEWVWDWYDDYNPSENNNPKGAGSGSTKVMRGGSAWDGEKDTRVSNRREYYPEESLRSFGFRVVRSVYK
jgi:sulfatase modifying factor 1